jgi:hypothetical protein
MRMHRIIALLGNGEEYGTMFAWRYLDPKITAQVILRLAERFDAVRPEMRHEEWRRFRLWRSREARRADLDAGSTLRGL